MTEPTTPEEVARRARLRPGRGVRRALAKGLLKDTIYESGKLVTYTDPKTGEIVQVYMTPEEHAQFLRETKAAGAEERRIEAMKQLLMRTQPEKQVYREGKVVRIRDPKTGQMQTVSPGFRGAVVEGEAPAHMVLKQQVPPITTAYRTPEGKIATTVRTEEGKEVQVEFKDIPTYREFLREGKIEEVPKPVEKPSTPQLSTVPPSYIEREEEFERMAEAQKQRQERFFGSPYMKRVEKVASYATFGFGKDIEERSEIGYQAQRFYAGVMTMPYTIGGTIAMTLEKSYLGGAAIRRGYGEEVRQERRRAFRETKKIYDPRTREGRSVLLAGLVFGAVGAAEMTVRGTSPFMRTKVEYTQVTKAPVVTKVDMTKPLKKVGTVETIDIARPLEVSKYKGRATPEQFVLMEMAEGKVKYYPGSARIARKAAGRYIDADVPIIEIAPEAPRATLAHELIHHKTPKFILQSRKISEAIAYKLEERYARLGFKVKEEPPTRVVYGQALVRKDEPLIFEYPREKVLVRQRGAEAPTVTKIVGTVKTTGEIYQLRATQVGRKISGVMIAKTGKDIYFKKVKGGKLRFQTREKPDITLIEEGKGIYKYEKVKRPEPIRIQAKETITIKGKDQFDIGQQVGGADFYQLRIAERGTKFTLYGGKVARKGLKTHKTQVVGKGRTRLEQIDYATEQVEVLQIGTFKRVDIKSPTIEYALQPKYKPDVKTYFAEYTKEGIVPGSLLVKKPQLRTQRITFGETTLKVKHEISRVETVKVGAAKFAGIVKQMLRSKRGELKLKPVETVKVYTDEPIAPRVRGAKLVIAPEEIVSVLEQTKKITIEPPAKAIPVTVQPTPLKPTPITKQPTIVITPPITKVPIKTSVKLPTVTKTPTKTKLPTKTKVPTMTKTFTPTKTKTPTKTTTRTVTEIVTKTVTKTVTPTAGATVGITTFIPRPPSPPPPPPITSYSFKRPKSKLAQAFDVFIKRAGEYKVIGKQLPLGKALKLGASKAKRTLAATFKVVPKGVTYARDIKFRPSPRVFREYKIQRGQRVETPREFIQKRRYRLATPSEVSEIQTFRRRR